MFIFGITYPLPLKNDCPIEKEFIMVSSENIASSKDHHNNGVFMGILSCRCVACEDAGRAAYIQLHLHVTGEYNRQQAGVSC